VEAQLKIRGRQLAAAYKTTTEQIVKNTTSMKELYDGLVSGCKLATPDFELSLHTILGGELLAKLTQFIVGRLLLGLKVCHFCLQFPTTGV
jgi:hypothetical protein